MEVVVRIPLHTHVNSSICIPAPAEAISDILTEQFNKNWRKWKRWRFRREETQTHPLLHYA